MSKAIIFKTSLSPSGQVSSNPVSSQWIYQENDMTFRDPFRLVTISSIQFVRGQCTTRDHHCGKIFLFSHQFLKTLHIDSLFPCGNFSLRISCFLYLHFTILILVLKSSST